MEPLAAYVTDIELIKNACVVVIEIDTLPLVPAVVSAVSVCHLLAVFTVFEPIIVAPWETAAVVDALPFKRITTDTDLTL